MRTAVVKNEGAPEHGLVAVRQVAEVTEVHTRILRLALGAEESRAYWEHADPATPGEACDLQAFEQRWFGNKSHERVRTLLANFAVRYDVYPEALAVLRRWRNMDLLTRKAVCHWHLQLADPIYRRFTGEFLPRRREQKDARLDRNVVLRWVRDEYPARWADATTVQFASKLLSATSEAGLISAKKDPRTFLFPRVTDTALAYLMYLLRGVRFVGGLLDNPFAGSVDLRGAALEQRLRNAPGLEFRRMGHLFEFEWAFDNLERWGEATL